MFINTTINLADSQVIKLLNVSEEFSISISKLICLIIKKVINNKNHAKNAHSFVFKRVSYQKKLSNDEWRKLHLHIPCELYEYCLDLRKLLKMSVSFIISAGINDFLDEIKIELNSNDSEDNSVINYIFISNIFHNMCMFITIWGNQKPKKLLKILKM